MDNFVQNINLDDIIPIEFQSTPEIDDLSISIKKYGIIEPLLVRQRNNKYEILSGKKRYQAAKLIGLTEIPALIRNIDDDFYKDYQSLNKKDNIANKFINPDFNSEHNSPNLNTSKNNKEQNRIKLNQNSELVTNSINSYEKNKNSDIINLAELNQKEYERDELKMNNTMNNGGMQPQNLNNMQESEPTFGGRFFPSLEDEPTNMNMGGMNMIGNYPQNQEPTPNNNLIDLTDINTEKEMPISSPNQNFQTPEPVQPEYLRQNIEIPKSQIGVESSTIQQSITNENSINQYQSQSDNISINQNIPTYNAAEINSQPNVNNSMDIPAPNLNPLESHSMMEQSVQDFANPIKEIEPQQVPTFDMSASMNPNITPPDITLNQEMTPVNPIVENNFEMPLEQQSLSNQIPAPSVVEANPNMPPINQGINKPISEIPSPVEEVQNFPQKEVEPVLNTLRTLATSLQNFGYNINIMEEDLGASAKITIEIQK